MLNIAEEEEEEEDDDDDVYLDVKVTEHTNLRNVQTEPLNKEKEPWKLQKVKIVPVRPFSK